MVIHIALFKWRKDVGPEETQKVTQEVRALKNKVPGIVDIHCGENFSKWNEGYTHAFLVLAKDREALEAYRNHPDHKKVAEKIDRMDGGSIGVDFED